MEDYRRHQFDEDRLLPTFLPRRLLCAAGQRDQKREIRYLFQLSYLLSLVYLFICFMQDIVWAPDSDMSVSHRPVVEIRHLLVGVGTEVDKGFFVSCRQNVKILRR